MCSASNGGDDNGAELDTSQQEWTKLIVLSVCVVRYLGK